MIAAFFLTTAPEFDFKKAGLEALAALKTEFAVAGVPGYSEAVVDGKPDGRLFNWGVGVLMSAMNAAARHDESWKAELRRFVEATRAYWNANGPAPGYDVLPGPKEVDRYYDDNAWMVLALVEAHTVLEDPKPLEYAKQALEYVLSGEDQRLGGGVYWRESDKASKNTCSNAPAVAACLAVYAHTKEAGLLERAKRLYAWTKRTLQDPTDRLMWDSVALDGTVDRTKWSYNTALMVRSAAQVARATGDDAYASDAKLLADASERRWIKDGRLDDVGRFAHLLVESWQDAPSPDRKEKATAALEWLYRNGRSEKGLYGPSFNRPASAQSRYELIDQASAARAFLVLS
jgi:rhamnogalacturonyl hydrolase YesR